MHNYFILSAAISTVVASPFPDFQSQQQRGDTTTPLILSPQPNDQLLASNPQNAQSSFDQTNSVPSTPFAMDIYQIAVGVSPSHLSNDVNPSTAMNVVTTNLLSSTVPNIDLGLSPSSEPLGLDTSTDTAPADFSTLDYSSSSPLAASPGPEVPDSRLTQEEAPLGIKSIFEPPLVDEEKRYADFKCGASASVCCQLAWGSQATAEPKTLACSASKHTHPYLYAHH